FVRKTAKRQGIHSASSFRFERGCDPHAVRWALQRAVQLIQQEAGGEVVTDVFDVRDDFNMAHPVDFQWKRSMQLIGKDIPKDTVKQILTDLDICITGETEEGLQLEVPLYRADVQREADVVEEVLRIYGYNNIEIPARMHSSLSKATHPDAEQCQHRVSDMLASIGFNEIQSMSLSSNKHLNLREELTSCAVEILNPLSGDLSIMRQSLLYGAMQAAELNQNHKNPDLRLFEFGKVYHKYASGYHEERHVSMLVTGRRLPENWNNASDKVSFADLRAAVERAMAVVGIGGVQFKSAEHPFFSEAVEVFAGKLSIGIIGALHSSILKAFDVK
ncbi:MAG: phenylalanine--tRNA ligase beta subunit-related protein, partial [Flavobacteriales bacterium]